MAKGTGAPAGQASFAALPKRTRPRAGGPQDGGGALPAAPRTCAIRGPPGASGESRDPGSGRQGARGRGGDVRHSVQEGARERRGRSSGECGRRGQRARWARRARRPRGRGGRVAPLFSLPAPPASPAEESAQGGAALTAGGAPGAGRAHVRSGARGSGGGGACAGGGSRGLCRPLLWSLLVLGSPLIAGARGPGPGGTPPPLGGEVPAPHPACRASPGPDCRPCGSAGLAIALK